MIKKNADLKIPVVGRVRECLFLLKGQHLQGKIVVDVGSSFGWLESKILKDKAKQLIGIDPNKTAIKLAQKNVPLAKFLLGDALDLPVKTSSADLVTLFDVIEHTPKNSEGKVLKEVARVLKRGGVLLLSTPNSHIVSNFLDPAWFFGHRHYQISEIESFLKKAGFEVEKSYIRGRFWTCLYLLTFYIDKWVLGSRVLKGSLLEKIYSKDFNLDGYQTIFVKAVKN